MTDSSGQTGPYRLAVGAVGVVTPPADMMDAARKSLDAQGFEELMRETGGRAPTPTELCTFCDARRAQL